MGSEPQPRQTPTELDCGQLLPHASLLHHSHGPETSARRLVAPEERPEQRFAEPERRRRDVAGGHAQLLVLARPRQSQLLPCHDHDIL